MSESSDNSGALTVVLVLGAHADGSSWNGVIEQLQAKGVRVIAPANPLRGIKIDSAYTASVFEPMGRSSPSATRAAEPRSRMRRRTRRTSSDGRWRARSRIRIDPAKFRDGFAADLPADQTALMAATQRSVAELAFSEPSGPPAWRGLPSWVVVATGDKVAGADVIRSMAERAGATITELEGSHVIMISQPEAVAEVIQTAAAAVDRLPAAAGG